MRTVPGVTSAFAERLTGGRYIEVGLDRARVARYGSTSPTCRRIVASAIGGENIGETVEGLQRFPINVRYPREMRDSLEKIWRLPIVTERGAQLRLGDVATSDHRRAADAQERERAPVGLGLRRHPRSRSRLGCARHASAQSPTEVDIPSGYSVSWSGQFEYLERATARLKIVVPFTLAIIFVLLYLTFGRFDEAAADHGDAAVRARRRILAALSARPSRVGRDRRRLHRARPASRPSSAWSCCSICDQAWDNEHGARQRSTYDDLRRAIGDGAVLRVRPKAMTVAVIIAGLLPVHVGHGTGSEVMQRSRHRWSAA